MNITKALSIDGWMSEKELLWLAEQASTCELVAEVGCWQGRSTRALVDNCPGVVYCVDHFRGSGDEHKPWLDGKGDDWLYGKFCQNMRDASGWTVCREDSLYQAQLFRVGGVKFDFVFFDADHSYEAVKADIEAWAPLVMEGGILAGHDMHFPGPNRAVTEMFPNHIEVPDTTIWAVKL